MSKFITGKALDDAICDIIFKAKDILVIVSPYIRLDGYFKKIFDNHQHNPNVHIVIVFGKNEGQVGKSFSPDDFEYFRKFNFLSVVYVPNLHGKYYGNEQEGVVTSINLHDYSFANNIEFGIHHQSTIMDNLKESTDQAAWNYCREVSKSHDVILIKRPVFEKKFLGLTKNFLKSETLFDATQNLLSNLNYEKKRLSEFPEFIEFGKSENSVRPSREEYKKAEKQEVKTERKSSAPDFPVKERKNSERQQEGYCIRTGVVIPYNPERPFSYDAYKSWAQYGNKDYAEKFCHRTGKPSNGKTSFANPVMTKW
ncbi:MAG: hypothetical protein M3Q56_01810 [Bacteroidota bacterium]|nr:hypothetical protein [Bacteroidota bacterium]